MTFWSSFFLGGNSKACVQGSHLFFYFTPYLINNITLLSDVSFTHIYCP